VHPVGGATAKLHTQNRTFRKGTHALTGAVTLVSCFRPNVVQPLNFSLPFPTLPYPIAPPFYRPFLPISPTISSSIPLSYSSLFPLTTSPCLSPPLPLFLPTYPFPSLPSLPISPPHSLSPLNSLLPFSSPLISFLSLP